jgi:hypothetical protein
MVSNWRAAMAGGGASRRPQLGAQHRQDLAVRVGEDGAGRIAGRRHVGQDQARQVADARTDLQHVAAHAGPQLAVDPGVDPRRAREPMQGRHADGTHIGGGGHAHRRHVTPGGRPAGIFSKVSRF